MKKRVVSENQSTSQILGFGFVPTYEKGSKNQYQLIVSEKAWKKLKERLKTITRKTTPATFEERIAKIKEVQRGWLNYFQGTSILGKLRDLDGWLRNRLRYCIWHHWKKPERKRKNLIRLGVDQDQCLRLEQNTERRLGNSTKSYSRHYHYFTTLEEKRICFLN